MRQFPTLPPGEERAARRGRFQAREQAGKKPRTARIRQLAPMLHKDDWHWRITFENASKILRIAGVLAPTRSVVRASLSWRLEFLAAPRLLRIPNSLTTLIQHWG